METRVRFAPSPTGYLHVGNARTAILNWLFARHTNGKFILRIEDTDVERSSRQLEEAIYEDLRWLGLDWDEGPDKGGEYGPYRQSERLSIYQDYAQRLLAEGKAYLCYCKPKTRKDEKQDVEKAHCNCYLLTEAEKRQKEASGIKPVVRFRVPKEEIRFDDIVWGEVVFSGENISDFVLLRSDGVATYNYAVVIDDALMRITHVIRGEDHISNTPKQLLLYKALGFSLPQFAHIPMILGFDHTRLSKRHGATSVRSYREKGYLPEAMVNFLSLLSWSSESGDELLSVERLIAEFDFSRISKSAAVFNPEKLNWMNGWYIRHTNLDRLVRLALPHLKKAGYDVSNLDFVTRVISVVQEKLEFLEQVPEMTSMFFQDSVVYSSEAREWLAKESSRKVFQAFLQELKQMQKITPEKFREIMKSVQKSTGIRGKELWMPIRVALTGRPHGPELPVVAELLGYDKCCKFVQKALSET